MVKTKIILYIIVATLITSCSVRYSSMQMKKEDYSGDEVRLDGYYFSTLSEARDQNNIDMYFVLYSNGIFVSSETFSPAITTSKVEKLILDRKNITMKHKRGSGLFKVENDSIIVVEYWNYAAEWPVSTGTNYGKILNDSTIRIPLFNRDVAWHFQPYHTKPDSTYAVGVDKK